MNKQQYADKIDAIRKKIKDDLQEGLEEQLEILYLTKPVRLIWFVTKSELILKQKFNLEEVYKYLESKCWRLYNYYGVDEFCKQYIILSELCNEDLDVNMHKWIYEKVTKNSLGKVSEILLKKLYVSRKYFIDKFEFFHNGIELISLYYQTNNYLMYEITSMYGKNYTYLNKSAEFIHDIPNMGYINTIVNSKDKNVFILVATNNDDYYDCIVLINILIEMGHRVYFIDLPMKFQVENSMDISTTLQISLENCENLKGATLIHPIEINYKGKNIGDNREYIIDYICKNYAENNLATVLCSGTLMDDLCMRPLMKKQMERLSPFQADYLEDTMAFGWVGKYTSYISKVYDFDVEAELDKPEECKFSIIIPARNSASSLRYTLKTCLNQRYKGCYEIVLSDNSTNGNTEVYNLCGELNDPRIKYYKTPRDLHLPKSFEFAYLKAKGEFIISIGSDDALLPWTLEVLDKVIKKYPEEQIFQWERGFYAWPGFNGGQENELLIPSKYEKDNYEVYNVDSRDYLAKVLNNPRMMYDLPMLYINSGFKRSYMKTLLDKTGRLWDGICQDIYMGVIDVAINKHITNIKYPLSIAGMTGNSVGAKSNIGVTDIKESNNTVEEVTKVNNIGGFSMSVIERLMPEVTTDISSLYNSILRAIARGVLPMEFLDNLLDWKKMFVECFAQLEVTDVMYDKKVHYFRYTAAKHGSEFLKWFDETIYEKALIPRKINEEKIEELLGKKTYKEGITETGKQILDASKYGVTNVYEASELFVKITGL